MEPRPVTEPGEPAPPLSELLGDNVVVRGRYEEEMAAIEEAERQALIMTRNLRIGSVATGGDVLSD